MIMQKVYSKIDVSVELPKEQGYYFVVQGNGVPNKCYFSFPYGFKDVIPTHWLKETDAFVFSKEELIELLKDAFDEGALYGNHYAAGTEIPNSKEQYLSTIIK